MTFYFYDLETSGVHPRHDRIMQFAGQRTDLELTPIGKPDNFLIKLTPDILPQPDAVMVHGTTPQKTIKEGLSEAEAAKYLLNQVFLPDTIIVGFNNIRFDDEFIRHLLWRNFYDAYEWQWKEHRSRWDILDLARITRALRPDGIQWPFASDGLPSNKLELLAAINKLEHTDAHDALSDVSATIAVARLLRNKQGKLFTYLLKMRDKTKVAALVEAGKPFLYTSGKYPSEYQKTTIASTIVKHPDRGAAIVYDLRVSPVSFANLPANKLAELWQLRGPEAPYFPVKKIAYNRCPAVAPLSVLDEAARKRLQLDLTTVELNQKKLASAAEEFGINLLKALEILDKQHQSRLVIDELAVDSTLYDSFINNPDDKTKMRVVRAANEQSIAGLKLDFKDERLKVLLPLYKARNFYKSLNQDELKAWETYCHRKLLSGAEESLAARYFRRISELKASPGLTTTKKNLLKELEAYGQSIAKTDLATAM